MARDSDDTQPIENKAELVAWIAAGCKPREKFRVGTEHEKFPYYKSTGNPVPYHGNKGIRALLEGMRDGLGWQPIMEGETIIGLYDVTGGGAISLEPGGQFELSGAPLRTIHETSCEIRAHMAQVHEVAAPLGIDFFASGTCPDWALADIPQMPKGRYKIMTAYMPKVGTRGLDMMYRTCTVQANVDFSSEADMVKKMRVSIALQPLATALFANSPKLDGRDNGFVSNRAEIWRDTDNARSGMIPFVFEDGFGFERYVDWALDVPMYFVKRGATYHDASGLDFKDLLAGKLPIMEGVRATIADWANHLSTLFPEVRLKRYLEMRGADAGPVEMLTALPAFWVGILYDESALDQAWQRVKGWSAEERQRLKDTAPRLGLQTPLEGGTLMDLAAEMLELARLGLARRGYLDANGCDETRYLEPLQRLIAGEPARGRYASLLRGEAG